MPYIESEHLLLLLLLRLTQSHNSTKAQGDMRSGREQQEFEEKVL